MKNTQRIVLLLIVVIVSTPFIAISLTKWKLHSQAVSLLREAVAVSPNDKTQALRSRWKQEFARYYVESNEHSFGIHLHNESLAKWHIAKAAVLSVDAYGKSGQVTDLSILFYSSNYNAPPAVMLSESLSDQQSASDRCTMKVFRIGSSNKIGRVAVHFEHRNRTADFFALNPDCLSSRRGCEAPQLLLPTLPNLQSSCTEVEHIQHTSTPANPY